VERLRSNASVAAGRLRRRGAAGAAGAAGLAHAVTLGAALGVAR
jgi:hypothetical protein